MRQWCGRNSIVNIVRAAIALGLLHGCVWIPYKPEAQVRHVEALQVDGERIALSTDPRDLLQDFEHAIANSDKDIEIRDSRTFSGTVFAGGDSNLKRLFAPDARRRIQELDVDYLVVVGYPRTSEQKIEGPVYPIFGIWGVGKGGRSTDLGAVVIDLAAGRPLQRLHAVSEGDITIAGWLFFVVTGPRTEESVIECLGKAAADAITGATKARPVGVVVMSSHGVGS